MKNEVLIVVLSEAGTFVLSVSTAMFISGVRWGEMRTKVDRIEKDVAEIKGMFVLKLRE